MKDTPHAHFAADDLIEQDVPVKGTQDDEKPPRRHSERSLWRLCDKDGVKSRVRETPTGLRGNR